MKKNGKNLDAYYEPVSVNIAPPLQQKFTSKQVI